MKVTVRIKTPSHEYSKTKQIHQDGEKEIVIIRKAKGDDLGWPLELPPGSVQVRNGWFGRVKRFVDCLPDAPKAIVYTPNMKSDDIPKYDKKTSGKLINARILHKAGEEEEKKSSAGLWVLAILQIITIIVVLYGTRLIYFG